MEWFANTNSTHKTSAYIRMIYVDKSLFLMSCLVPKYLCRKDKMNGDKSNDLAF